MATLLKDFQQAAVGCVAEAFLQDLAVGRTTSALLEAPTGIGKTLMAGRIAQAVSQQRDVVWFWFAPFETLIHQTQAAAGAEFSGLRVRDIRIQREVHSAQAGDLFVLTWALATNERSNVNREGEVGEPLSAFVAGLKAAGFQIGVVDEAHHSFKMTTRAFQTYRQNLSPDLTLMVTATPNDAALAQFREHAGAEVLHQISISRQNGVEAGLLKPNIITDLIEPGSTARAIDTRRAALRLAVRHHRTIKARLEELALPLTPLLLVQMDSDPGSVERTRQWLAHEGFSEEQLRVHTADEPTGDLSKDARDPDVEVIAFKMAIATGFDAPRAFTLCSMRAVLSEDFGMQIVGRLARVDRVLQPLIKGLKDTPQDNLLRYGRVYLAVPGKQEGLVNAAARIQAIQDAYNHEFGPTERRTAEQGLGDSQLPGQTASGPVTSALALATERPAVPWQARGFTEDVERAGPTLRTPLTPLCSQAALRAGDLGMPRRLRTVQVRNPPGFSIEQAVAAHFDWKTAATVALQTHEQLTHTERGLFDQHLPRTVRHREEIAIVEVREVSSRLLDGLLRFGEVNRGRLLSALEQGLATAITEQGLPVPSEDGLATALDKVIALRADLLRQAISRASVGHAVAVDAAPLPHTLYRPAAAPSARKGSYGFMPEINGWERRLVSWLEEQDEVLWWHRNEPRQDHSVGIPIPGANNFFADLAVGVRDRPTRDHVLLMEPKGQINDTHGDAALKARVRHPDYGRPMMLWLDEATGIWRIVEHNPATGANALGPELTPVLLRVWGLD